MRTKLILALLCVMGLCLLCGTALAATEVDLTLDSYDKTDYRGDVACLFKLNKKGYMDVTFTGGSVDVGTHEMTYTLVLGFHAEKRIKPTQLTLTPYPNAASKGKDKYNPYRVILFGIADNGDEVLLVNKTLPIPAGSKAAVTLPISTNQNFTHYTIIFEQIQSRSKEVCLKDIRLSGDVAPLTYLDASGSAKSTTDYVELDDKNTEWPDDVLTIRKNTSLELSELLIRHDTLLVLQDGATLNVADGIHVDNCTLTITCESGGTGSGRLVVQGPSNHNNPNYRSAIGGYSANVIINGGNIEVTYGSNASGIGDRNVTINRGVVTVTCTHSNGTRAAITGNVTINGGTVTAKAELGAGISGSVTINGGTVTAQSWRGAGIGMNKGNTTATSSVRINGGTVNASSDEGAGIGGCCLNGGPVHVYISGGTVTAQSSAGAGIGGGLGYYNTMSINISGGYVTARGGVSPSRDVPVGYVLLGGYSASGIGAGAPYCIKQKNGSLVTKTYGAAGTITITGGTVIATPGSTDRQKGAQAIGNNVASLSQNTSNQGTLTIGDGMQVVVDGNTAFTEDRVSSARSQGTVRVQPCQNGHGSDAVCSFCGVKPMHFNLQSSAPGKFLLKTDKDVYYPEEVVTISVLSLDASMLTGMSVTSTLNASASQLNASIPSEEEQAVNIMTQAWNEIPVSAQELLRLSDIDLNEGGQQYELYLNQGITAIDLPATTLGLEAEDMGEIYATPHAVTIQVSGNGTVTTTKEAFSFYQTVPLSYYPDSGYIVDSVSLQMQGVGIITYDASHVPSSFHMPAVPVTVSVTFKQNPYSGRTTVPEDACAVSVAASPAACGAVSGGDIYKVGSPVTVIATPAEDCSFGSWTMNGEVVSTSASYTFYPTENCELTAVFSPPAVYTITTVSNGPGTLTASVTSSRAGKTITLYPVGNEGCGLSIWTQDGTDYWITDDNTFIMPERNVTVTANFAVNKYVVEATTSFEQVVEYSTCDWGSQITVTAPNVYGYAFHYWIEDGDTSGTILSTDRAYTFTVYEEHHLTAVYAPTYTIAFGYSLNGYAEGDGMACAFTVSLTDSTVNGVYGDLEFTDGVAEVTLQNGDEVNVSGLRTEVAASIEPAPPEGLTFVSWVDAEGLNDSNPSLSYSLEDDNKLKKAFFNRTYTVTVDTSGGGKAYADVAAATEGSTVYLTAAPDTGYTFVEWQVLSGGVTVDRWYEYTQGMEGWYNTFELPAANVSVRAVFARCYEIVTDDCFCWVTDGHDQPVEAKQAIPGTKVFVRLDDNDGILDELYFLGTFSTQGVEIGIDDWGRDCFYMPENDVFVFADLEEREYPVYTLTGNMTLEVPSDVASQIIYSCGAEDEDPEDEELSVTIDLNSDQIADIRVVDYIQVELPEDLSEEEEEAFWASYTPVGAITRLPGSDLILGPVDVLFDDYGQPHFTRYIGCTLMVGTPLFGPATFTLPEALTAIEASAFEGDTLITIVDASHCASIGAKAFGGCTGLTQIRLPMDCAISETAFEGCGPVYVYAPGGGATEAFFQNNPGFTFVELVEMVFE